jgi:fucose permease
MPKTLITTPAVTPVERAAAAVSAVAAVAFAVLLVGLHIVQPELDLRWRFISEYVLGRAGWMMTTAFVALALSQLAAVAALARQVRTWPGRIGLALLVVAAIGLVMAAVFPTDPITTPAGAQTTSGQLHNLGAALDWSPVGMLLLAVSLGRTTTGHIWRRRLLIAAAVPCLLTLAFIATAAAAGGHVGPGSYAGLVGRLMLLSYLGWFLTLARTIRTPARTTTGVSSSREPVLA